MKNNVYGIIGLSAIQSNWNANWDKMPKENANGDLIASPFVLKYCNKVEWDRRHKKVMGLKTFKIDGTCNNQNDRYTNLFGKDEKNVVKKTSKAKVDETLENNYLMARNNLLSCEDILNYGIVYTGVNSQSITGVVQIRDGINKFEGSSILTEKMITPYSNLNKEDASMTSCGDRIVIDEAHFLHDFTIFPKEYDKYINEGFGGYTEESYQSFKDVSLVSVTKGSSIAKNGCNNEFAVFVKAKEGLDYLSSMHSLSDYVEVTKEDKVIYDVTGLFNLLNDLKEEIEDVELYYNPRKTELKGFKENEKFKLLDIMTRKVI